MIEEYRKEIDKLDAQVIELMAKRMDISHKIGDEKRSTGVEIHAKTREIRVLDLVKLLADQKGLDESFVTNLYQVILTESRRVQGA